MKRGELLKTLASLPIVGTLFASPAVAADPIVRATSGETLVFRIKGGYEDMVAFAKQLPSTEGVRIILVNESVEVQHLRDFLDERPYRNHDHLGCMPGFRKDQYLLEETPQL